MPYPYATADHQTVNARFLVDSGAASLVADAAIDTAEFSGELFGLLDDPSRREGMRKAALALGQSRAAAALADQVEAAARA